MKASAAHCKFISNVCLNILGKIKPAFLMDGIEVVHETATTSGCIHSSQDWITENCYFLPCVE